MYWNHLEIQQHGKKIKVEDENDDSNHDNQEQALWHDFWNQAPDDVLTEIFIRHPDSRSALRTTTVCRHWRSLISRNPHFIERFKSHHRRHHHRYPPKSLPATIMLRKSRLSETLLQLYSDEWVFLHGRLPNNCFDFLPHSPCMVIIKASCNDLFLVSTSPADQDHYVCNPITKQFVHIPSIPIINDGLIIGCALVRTQSGPTADNDMRFKVVVVLPPHDYPPSLDLNLEPKRILPVKIYSSESREWETRSFRCPELGSSLYEYVDHNLPIDIIITCNGVLYWMGKTDKEESVVVCLDLFSSRVIRIPSTYSDDMFVIPHAHRIGIVHVSGGLQELRLLRVDTYVYETDVFFFKVWTLKNNGCWSLVHNKRLEAPEILSEEFPLAGAFFHPTNGDFVFIVLGKKVIQYNLSNGIYKKIGELGKAVSWPMLTSFVMVGA